MSCNVLFSNKMIGKNLIVEKNDKGWYKVKLGELNNFNSKDEYYLEEGFKELLSEQNSYLSVKNRLESGLLKGECTHPIREGHSDADWLTRNMIIHDAFASHQFMEIMMQTTNNISLGRNIIEIWAWILPCENDCGKSLKADLDNPDVNVAFSIRCFSKVVNHMGRVGKIITKIVCWDRIDIPGLKNAVKGGNIDAITREAGLTDVIISGSTLDVILNTKNFFTNENAGLRSEIMDIKNTIENNSDKKLFFKW